MTVAFVTWLGAWLLLPNIPAAIAHAKGRDFVRYYALGLVVLVIAIPLAIVRRPDYETLAQRDSERRLARRLVASKRAGPLPHGQ